MLIQPTGGLLPFNSIYKKDLQTGVLDVYWNGNYRLYQEPVSVHSAES